MTRTSYSKAIQEHVTFGVLHHLASKDPSKTKAQRASHRLAAKAHEHTVVQHLRLRTLKKRRAS